MNCSPSVIGFNLLSSFTRGNGCRLQQSHTNNTICANLFHNSAMSRWNKLSISIITPASLAVLNESCMNI